MVWGNPGGQDFVARWEPRLRRNDPTLTSLAVLPTTRLKPGDVARLAAALRGNTTLTDLSTSGHPLSIEDVEALAGLLHGDAPADAAGGGDANGNSGIGSNDGNGDGGDAASSGSTGGDASASTGPSSSSSSSSHLRSGIKQLAVGDAQTGDEASSALMNALARPGHPVRRVDMSFKGITAASSPSLAAVLSGGPVETVLLARNSVGCDGAVAIAEHVNKKSNAVADDSGNGAKGGTVGCKHLAHLDLSSNGIGERGTVAVSGAVAGGALGFASLRMCDNPIGPGGGHALAGAISSAGRLRELRVNGCDIGDRAAAALLRALCECPATTVVEIAKCGLGPLSAAALKAHLPTSSVTRLAAGENPDLGDDGACDIAAGLSGSRVSTLDLGSCEIKGRGYHELAAAEAPSLTELLLFGNPAGDAGVDALASAAMRSGGSRRGIRLVDIGGNGVTARGFLRVCDALRRGCFPDVEELDIGANAAEDEMDAWQETADTFAEDRPHIRVAWRVQARPDGGAGGGPPGEAPPVAVPTMEN